ncbi:MAG: dihydroorotase [Bacteroidia bacterium]
MNTCPRNVKVVDPQSEYHNDWVTITIEEGFIADIEPADEGHRCVSPGWVDTGAHLCDPGHEHKESLSALARAAAFGGFTDVLCYPNTLPATDDSSAVSALVSRSKGLPVNLHFMGALTPGASENDLAELYDMHQAGALAFSDGRRESLNSSLVKRALHYMQAFGGLLLMYPNDRYLGYGAQMNESEESVYLGMKGSPEMAETAALASILHIHEYTGGRLHLQPLTSARSLHMAQGREGISTAVSIAHLAWDDSAVRSFDTNYKINPPLRSKSQREALIQALADGKVDALCSYHQAQSVEEKLVEWPFAEPGMLALQTLFPLAMKHLVHPGHINLDQLISMLTSGPRRLLGLEPLIIDHDVEARITVFDPEEAWTFSKETMFSRAVNSPLIGERLKGKAIDLQSLMFDR